MHNCCRNKLFFTLICLMRIIETMFYTFFFFRFELTVADMDSIEGAVNPRATLEQLAVSKDLPVAMRSIQGEVRYCSECSHVKPDRTHHCSVCGQCVLKMDHHCPWYLLYHLLINIIEYYRHKFDNIFL